MVDANKHSAIKGYGDALKQEAELENARYKNDASLPSENDNMAGLFSSISDAAKSPGGRPRGVGASIAAGLSEGISTGYKMKSTQEKKEKFGKYENAMNYFQKVQAEVTKQNQHYAEQEQRMETVKPFAVGALEVAYSGMSYDQGNERMRNIIDQAKLADPRIKGDYIGYVPNSPIVNLRDQDGNITAFSLSSLTGEETVKRVQGNYIDQQKLATEREFAPQKYEAMGRRADNAEERTRQMSQKTYMSALQKYAPKIEAASRVQVISHKMKDLVKNNPGMFQSVLSSVWDSNDPGVIQKVAQKFANGPQAEAVKEMGKYIQELKIGVIKGLSNPNQSIDMIAAGTIPGKGMPDNSILKILDDLDYKAGHEIELNKEYLNEVKGTFGENRDGGDKYKQKAEDYISGATSGAGNPQAQDEWSALGNPSQ
jgi:hypothetical protein